MEQYIRNRIIEIARYVEETEIPCRSCGCVNEINEIKIVPKQYKVVRYQGLCNHCGTFIKFMPVEKIERIYWKGVMCQISEFETSLLQWMINKKKYGPKISKYINLELKGRMGKISKKDIPIDNKLYYSYIKNYAMEDELHEIIQEISDLQNHVIVKSHELDYFEINRIQKRISALRKKELKLRLEISKS